MRSSVANRARRPAEAQNEGPGEEHGSSKRGGVGRGRGLRSGMALGGMEAGAEAGEAEYLLASVLASRCTEAALQRRI